MDQDVIAGFALVGAWVAVVAGLLGAIVATKRERRRAEHERLMQVDRSYVGEENRLSNLERSVESIAIDSKRPLINNKAARHSAARS